MVVLIDKCVQVAENFRAPSTTPQSKASTFNSNSEVEFIINKFQDFAVENEWTANSTLGHVTGASEEASPKHPRTRYGTSLQQGKERLLGSRRDPKASVFDFAAQSGRLVGLANP